MKQSKTIFTTVALHFVTTEKVYFMGRHMGWIISVRFVRAPKSNTTILMCLMYIGHAMYSSFASYVMSTADPFHTCFTNHFTIMGAAPHHFP
jgi:hypothetical protein